MEMEDRMDDSKSTRRKVLKTGGMVLAAMTGVSSVVGAASTKASPKELNPEFDPRDRSEVKEFMQLLLDKEREEQENIYRELTSDRQEAVEKSLSVKGLKESTKPTYGISAAGQNDWTHVLEAYAWHGENVWEFHHEINWQWDLDSMEILPDKTRHSASPANVSLGWNWNGIQDEYKTAYADRAVSKIVGKFTYGLGSYGPVHVQPWTKIAGIPGGRRTLLEKHCPDCATGFPKWGE
jgi:hypothetical protein